MTNDNPSDEPTDSDLFRAAITGTRPLKNQNKIIDKPKNKKIRQTQQQPDQSSYKYPLSDHLDHSTACTAEETLTYLGNGVQQRFFKKLRKGQVPIEARLDLHGFTVEVARHALSEFIDNCLNLHYRCVIIVHGKGSRGGQPILKPMISHWLPQISDVLAFCSALPKDGGTGAVYVLLKNTGKK